MSAMHHTCAIILKREGWGEADLLLTALTEDFGRIRLVAQGARKHGAKLQGHLEPGSRSELSFVVGRNGYRLTTAELADSYPSIRASLHKIASILRIFRIIDANLLEDRDRSHELFRTVASALDRVEAIDDVGILRRIEAWFVIRFLAFLGLLPARESREASGARTVLAIGSAAIEDLERFPIKDEVIAAELAHLSLLLEATGAFERPLGSRDFALY